MANTRNNGCRRRGAADTEVNYSSEVARVGRGYITLRAAMDRSSKDERLSAKPPLKVACVQITFENILIVPGIARKYDLTVLQPAWCQNL